MREPFLDVLSAGLLTALAVMSLRAWSRERRAAGLWLVLTFVVLAFVTVSGVVLPDERRSDTIELFLRGEIALLALLPYMLHRFASTFDSRPRWFEHAARALTVIALVAVLWIDELPEEGQPFSTQLTIAASALVLQWTVLLASVAIRLWRGGSKQAAVARQRMRLLSVGAVGIVIAIAIAATVPDDNATGDSITAVILILSALAFYAGYIPPRALRTAWQAGTQDSIRAATIALMETDQQRDLSTTFLPHVAGLVGASAAAMIRGDGTIIGTWQVTTQQVNVARSLTGAFGDTNVVAVEVPFGQILLWTSPYTPFFGSDELNAIRSMGAIIELALERYESLSQQRTLTERLIKVNELKNEFVAVVAHDLRSPMSVIAGFAHTLDDQWELMPEPRKREILRIIASSTESLALLVEDVLQVARIESGEMRYDKQPFDIVELIERVARDMRALQQHEIEVDIEAGIPKALGDQDRYWQVLSNLVNNAMKFSPPQHPVVIHARNDPRTEMIEVSVEDRGIGISPKDQPTLFDKFVRITPADQAERVKGTGLGLYICKTIVEAHGGKLTVTSTPGQGSTFRFTIPNNQDTNDT